MDITHFFTYIRSQFDSQEFDVQVSSTLLQVDGLNFLLDTGFADRLDVIYALNKLGLSAMDIDYVLNTHAHPDHIGGNQHFIQAEIYVSEADLTFQRDYMNSINAAEGGEISEVVGEYFSEFNPNQIEAYGHLSRQMANIWRDEIIGESHQLHFIEEDWPFDHIEAFETPGHSKGHYSFKVNTPGKPFLITGDALSTRSSFQMEGLDFPYCYDSRLYRRSQRWIRGFEGIIIPGHDKPFDTGTGDYLEHYEALRDKKNL